MAINIKPSDVRFAERLPKAKMPLMVKRLKEYVIDLVEDAFRSYMSKHKGITQDTIEIEWQRFKRHLESKL